MRSVQIPAGSAPLGYCCYGPITNTRESENTAASSETHEGRQLLKHSACSQHYSQRCISEQMMENCFCCHGNTFPAPLIDVFTTERRDTEYKAHAQELHSP